MYAVTIYHNVSEMRGISPEHACGRFIGYCPEHSTMIPAYTYFTENADLDVIWRENNRVDGTEVLLNKHQARSLSVGDIIQVNDRKWSIEPFGFKEVT